VVRALKNGPRADGQPVLGPDSEQRVLSVLDKQHTMLAELAGEAERLSASAQALHAALAAN